MPGNRSTPGSVTWSITDNGRPIETSNDRFNVAVTSYLVRDENDDGIYEPGSEVIVTNVRSINNGGLTLPPGAVLQFPSTPTAISKNVCEVIPQLRVHEVNEAKSSFQLYLPEHRDATQNSSLRKTANIVSHSSLLGRVFPESLVQHPLQVQWPVAIAKIDATTFLGPGEVSTIMFHVENKSNKPYGMNSALGAVEVRLRADPLLRILEPADRSYIVRNGVAIKQIDEIPPRSTYAFAVNVLMTPEAGVKLFEQAPWLAELHLRGTLCPPPPFVNTIADLIS
jgi:hypothetical protein